MTYFPANATRALIAHQTTRPIYPATDNSCYKKLKMEDDSPGNTCWWAAPLDIMWVVSATLRTTDL